MNLLSKNALLVRATSLLASGILLVGVPAAAQQTEASSTVDASKVPSLQIVTSPQEAEFYNDLRYNTLPKLNQALDRLSMPPSRIPQSNEWSQVQRELAAALSLWQNLNRELTRPSVWKIAVLGEVARPSLFDNKSEGWKPERLVEAIAKCGGWTSKSALDKVTIIRPTQKEGEEPAYEVIKVNLNAFLLNGDPAGNPPINNGDTIVVGERIF